MWLNAITVNADKIPNKYFGKTYFLKLLEQQRRICNVLICVLGILMEQQYFFTYYMHIVYFITHATLLFLSVDFAAF